MDTEELLLGIDLGTSSCKAAAFRRDGSVAAQANRSYPIHIPRPGWAEQDPDAWWDAVCAVLRELSAKGVTLGAVRGIGVDGQSWSAVAVDREGKALCGTPIWMDTRAQAVCARLRERFGGERLFRVSGNPVQPMYTLPKVLWYKENRPEVYRATAKILQSNSFLVFRLTGAMTQDRSQGYGWSCYDIARGAWDADLCREMGVDPAFLPEIAPCHAVVGRVTAQAAEQTGLPSGIPVVAGGLDAACGALGAGVVRPGETQEQGGQAGGMSICTDACTMDPSLILSAHVVPGRWLLQGGTVGGGGAVGWFEREFCASERALAQEKGTSSLAEMDAGAAKVPPGSDGLVFLPYLAGERSPVWDPDAKGVFYGVDFAKTRAHFARAVMEGVAYSLRHNLEVAERAGARAQTLRAVGGAANSRLWMQIKADVTGRKLAVPSADTATALGAALLAGVGTGYYAGFEEAAARTVSVRREFEPDPANARAYSRGYAVYRELYESLKTIMHGGGQK